MINMRQVSWLNDFWLKAKNFAGSYVNVIKLNVDDKIELGQIVHQPQINEAVALTPTSTQLNKAVSLSEVEHTNALFVAKNGNDSYDGKRVDEAKLTIQAAVTAASSGDTVFVFPGDYNETITLKNGVNIVALDPNKTRILQQVTDNNVVCVCYLKITIASASGNGINVQHASSIITHEGNIGSSVAIAILLTDGTLVVNNGLVTCTLNTNVGHGISVACNNLTLHNTMIVCTHADAKSIYAAGAQNAYCMNVWANRNDDANITQKINGFNIDSDVQ